MLVEQRKGKGFAVLVAGPRASAQGARRQGSGGGEQAETGVTWHRLRAHAGTIPDASRLAMAACRSRWRSWQAWAAAHSCSRAPRCSAACASSRLLVGSGRLSGVGLFVKAGPAKREALVLCASAACCCARAGSAGVMPPCSSRAESPLRRPLTAGLDVGWGAVSARLRGGDARPDCCRPGTLAVAASEGRLLVLGSRWCLRPLAPAGGETPDEAGGEADFLCRPCARSLSFLGGLVLSCVALPPRLPLTCCFGCGMGMVAEGIAAGLRDRRGASSVPLAVVEGSASNWKGTNARSCAVGRRAEGQRIWRADSCHVACQLAATAA